MDYRKNLPLVVGLTLPVLLIIIVAATIYIPTQLVKPQHDFLYMVGGDFHTQREYVVENGVLIKREVPRDPEKYPPYDRVRTVDVTFYRHDVKTNMSRQISFEEAQRLTLDPSLRSPDGFTIERGGSDGIFDIFGGGSRYDDLYLRNKQASTTLDLELERTDYYGWSNSFLGWIIQ